MDHVSQLGVQHGGQTALQLAWVLAGKLDAIGEHLQNGVGNPIERDWRSLLEDLSWKAASLLSPWISRSNPRTVYFDVLHLFTVVYDERIAVLLNSAVLTAGASYWLWLLASPGGVSVVGCVVMTGALIGAALGLFGSATFAAFVYSEVLEAKLSWFGSYRAANFVFLTPALFGVVSALLLVLPRRLRAPRVLEMYFAVAAFYGALLLVCTRYGLMSGYLPLASFLGANVSAMLWTKAPSKKRIFACHIISGMPSAALAASVWVSTLKVFLPLFGRMGSKAVPMDILAAVTICYNALVYFVVPLLPVLICFPRALWRLRTLAFLAALASAIFVLTTRTEITIPNVPTRQIFSKDAPRRLAVIHFHAPQMEPPSVVAISAFDSLPLSQEKIVQQFMSAGISANDRIPHIPAFGKLDTNVLEPVRPFASLLGGGMTFRTTLGPKLEVPRAEVTNETPVGDFVNVSIKITAPDTHALTVRIPVDGKHGAVRISSFQAPLQNTADGKGMWIRHVGSEEFRMSLLVNGTMRVSSKQPNILLAVSSSRLGVSRSEVLPFLGFDRNHTALLLQTTCAELAL